MGTTSNLNRSDKWAAPSFPRSTSARSSLPTNLSPLPRICCDSYKMKERERNGKMYKETKRCPHPALWKVGNKHYCDPHFNIACGADPSINFDVVHRLSDNEEDFVTDGFSWGRAERGRGISQ